MQAVAPLWKEYRNNRALIYFTYAIAIILFALWLLPYVTDKSGARLVQTTITGLLLGGVYALVALGIVIINKASGVFNFAHGWLMVLGGMIFFSFFTVGNISPIAAGLLAFATVFMVITTPGYRTILDPRYLIGGIVAVIVLIFLMINGGIEWRWIHALVGTVCGSILIGLFVERFTIRPLIGQPLFTAVLMTLALAEMFHGTIQILWGAVTLDLPIFIDPATRGGFRPLRIDQFDELLGGSIIIQVDFVIAFVLAVIAFGGFMVFFRYTNTGLAMRATSENQQLAQSVGLRVRTILATTWVIAVLMAAIAGILQGGAAGLSQNINLMALRVFPAILLGGLESIGGAFVGGIVIGLVEQFGILLFPNQVGTELAPYLVLMLVLVIRPDGLFGEKRIERI